VQVILFFGLPVLVSLLIPRQWIGALLVTVAFAWGVLFIDFSRIHAGAGDLMGMGLLSLATLLMLVVLVLRQMVASGRKLPNSTLAKQRWARAYVTGLLALASTLVLTAVLVQLCNTWWHTAWLTHLALVVVALLAWVLVPLAWPQTPPLLLMWHLHPANVVRWIGVVTMLLTVAWSLQSGRRVVQAAQQAAGGQAYCLMSATEEGLRPATSVLDLAGFSMQAGRGAMRHAQMATGSENLLSWRYWSYRQAAFVPEPLGGVLTCEVQTNYATKLPWFAETPLPDAVVRDLGTSFWLAGGHWQIPSAFIGRASDKPASLSFYAHGKDFGPPQGVMVRSGPQSWEQIAQNVSVALCPPEKIHVWYRPMDARHQVRTVAREHGLDKQEVVTAANQVPSIQYVEKDSNGEPLTWIACNGPNASCHHAFLRDGMNIQFMHAANDLPDWKQMQDALWHRIQSFAMTWPEPVVRNCSTKL